MRLALAAVLLAPAAALAQAPGSKAAAPTTAPAAPVDPARLEASRRLIDQILPPAGRENMIEQMIAPMMANMNRVIAQDPNLAALLGKNPKVQATVGRFMERQTSRTIANLRSELPAMSEAMSRAYARRFDVPQLREISAFFATPTGRAYLESSQTLMSDPDVLAWQTGLMTKSMSKMHDDIAGLTKELLAESEDEK